MIVLVTGGSGSGKSEYAENLAVALASGPLIYAAAMLPYGEESRRRIARHQEMRKEKGFRTIEHYLNIGEIPVDEGATLLIECMSNLTANEMFEPEGAGEDTVTAITRGIRKAAGRCQNLVIVTNEIFSDGIRYPEETRKYQENLGVINRYLAGIADHVIEVVYTIPVFHKGGRL